MKKAKFSIMFLCAVCALGGCHSDIDQNLSTLERKVNNLYETVSSLNVQVTQIQSLFKKLQQYDYVKSVREDFSHDEKTYVISFTNSDPITLSCGSDAETPVIGIAYDIDGRAYWTVRYGNGSSDFILNEYDQKVLVSAITPLVRINEDGKWEVSYNEGKVWKSLGITAAGAQGASFVESVEEVDGYLQIKLLSGDVINFPMQDAYDKLMEDVKALNENIESLMAFANDIKSSLVSVKSVTQIVKDDEEVGFKLTLTDNTSYSFYHGTSTNKPVVSAVKDSDNPSDTASYWAIKYAGADEYEWILTEEGNKMRADYSGGTYPMFNISADTDGSYIWMISNDGGKTFSKLLKDGKAVVAQTAANDAGITSLTKGNGYYILRIFDQVYQIPDNTSLNILFDGKPADSLIVKMAPSDTVKIQYQVQLLMEYYTSPNSMEIAAFAKDGFRAWVEKIWVDFLYMLNEYDGYLYIVSPDTFTSGSTAVNVMFSDSYGRFSQFDIKIVSDSEEEEQEEETQTEEEE